MFSKIKKRDGKVVPFDVEKITTAISKAGKVTSEFGEKEAQDITNQVMSLAKEKISAKIPTVEEQIAKGEKNPNFFVENNMSTERCEKEGRPIKPMLEQFLNELEGCKYLLAHNMNFDLPVTASEMYRLGFQAKNKPQKICTMQSTTDICQLPGPHGFKWPSLQELHKFLFGCDFEGAHDASDDVTAMAKCFFELKRRNLLVITE